MSPPTQLRWTIIAALLMWSPVAYGLIAGNGDLMRGGILFIVALVIAYIGVTIVASLVNTYQRTQQQVAAAQRQIKAIERRRAELAELDAADEEKRRRFDDEGYS